MKLIDKVGRNWVDAFQSRHNIVLRQQTGKLKVCRDKELDIETEVTFHLGVLKRQFDYGELDESMVENKDETHFIVNMDHGRTLAFKGFNSIKHEDVVSGGGGMTLVVRITGGVEAIHASM